VSRVISGGEDAEEKIAARKRMLAGVDPTRHAEEGSKDTDPPKGESAALSKSMLLEMYLSDAMLCAPAWQSVLTSKSMLLEMYLSDTGPSTRWGRAGDRMIIQKNGKKIGARLNLRLPKQTLEKVYPVTTLR